MTIVGHAFRFGFIALALGASPAMATSSVQLFTSLSPVRIPYVDGVTPGYEETSPNFAAYQANVYAGLMAGGVAEGAPGLPGSFTPTSATSFNYTDAFGTSFNSWRGDVAPTGVYAGEYGTYVRTSGLVVSSTPFTLADVYQSYSDINGAQPADDFADYLTGFGGDIEGLSYGADGLKGTADDVLYDAANPGGVTSAVNELYYFGYAQVNSFCPKVCLADYASPQAALDDYGAFIASAQPYAFSETLALEQDAATTSATFNGFLTAAPEPSAWLLMLVGVGFLGLALRRCAVDLPRENA